jgi:hypothetical protein
MPVVLERGSFLKRVFVLALFAGFILAAAKTLTVYRSSSQLADYIRDRAVRVAAENVSASRLRAEIANYGSGLGLPVKPADIQVATNPGTVSIKLNYTVPVDFRLFTWNLRFTPSVESRAY